VVCRGPVAVVKPQVEGEDGQIVPLEDGHEPGAARYRVDAECAACADDHLVVPEGIKGRFASQKDGDPHSALFLEQVGDSLRRVRGLDKNQSHQ
jgi:hypothetical protein